MMILVGILIVAILLAVALSGLMADARRRHWRLPANPWAHRQADWWPEFERQFRAYVREREREAH